MHGQTFMNVVQMSLAKCRSKVCSQRFVKRKFGISLILTVAVSLIVNSAELEAMVQVSTSLSVELGNPYRCRKIGKHRVA
jgi:hypothetical protein